VASLLDHGLDLAKVTLLVGENGSGKSTIVEAVAAAFGLSPEGGSVHARHSTRA
jgi:predicted ATPase